MKPTRPPVKIPNEDPLRLLLLEEWYEIFEPMYRYVSDTAADPAVNAMTDQVNEFSEEILEYIGFGGNTAIWVIGIVTSLVVEFARYGLRIGKFEYLSGELGTAPLGSKPLGKLETREIE